MAPINKFYSFVDDLAEARHNFSTDQLEIALTNTAPAYTNTQLSNITQISYTNLSSRVITTVSSSQSSGLYKLILSDLTLNATGVVPTFRYIVLFNQTSASDLLIGWYDYGSPVNLVAGETFTIDFDGTNGAISLA
jgi:hypothetical protein